ncbi:MAG: TetR/AcrR family transcriptional regulator [Actinomycetota bacterium]|nr:TetR/AcrR family transcriptional regulator [Actinomycetota bacterium]
MAKPGTSSRLVTEGTGRSAATKQLLVQAAIETLKAAGFAGASARAIAGRAGCNQALIFYHFGSVVSLLLAALDAVSASRLKRYSAAVGHVGSPAELVEVAAAIFREDLDAGYVTVLVEMIAGASSTPGLGAEVAARIAPWQQFAQQIIDSTLGESALASMIPSGEVAHGVVALYLGLELLSHLDGDRATALSLFDRAKQLAAVLQVLGVGGFLPATMPGQAP